MAAGDQARGASRPRRRGPPLEPRRVGAAARSRRISASTLSRHRGIQALAVGEVAVEHGLARCRPRRRCRPCPTPAPCWRMARRVASTSSRRRVARCSSQRVLRPSVRRSLTGRRTVAGTGGTCYCPYSVTCPSRTSPRPRHPRWPARVRSPAAPPSSAATASRSRAPTARTRKASNQDMLTAALEGLVARFGLAGERVGEVAAGAVLKHSRDFNLTREAVLGSQPRRRTTPGLRRAAGLRHRPRGGRSSWPTRSPSARSSPASPAAPTPPPTPRSPSTRGCARRC